MTDLERDKILDEIVQKELAMFLATPTPDGPSEYQQRPETFKLMRYMTHSAHDKEFLQSYLNDLRDAEKAGRNFMIEKYALMDDLIEPLSDDPLLDEIADAETDFLDEAAELYPQIIKRDGSSEFHHYLRSELQTLSPQSLALYAAEIRKARKEGRNPALARHNWLARKLGKPSLDDNES